MLSFIFQRPSLIIQKHPFAIQNPEHLFDRQTLVHRVLLALELPVECHQECVGPDPPQAEQQAVRRGQQTRTQPNVRATQRETQRETQHDSHDVVRNFKRKQALRVHVHRWATLGSRSPSRMCNVTLGLRRAA